MLKALKDRITAAKVIKPASIATNPLLHRFLFLALLIAIWAYISWTKIYPDYLLPSPASVIETLSYGFQESNFAAAIVESLRRAFIGYIFAISIGFFAGLAIARYAFIDNSIGTSLTALQSIPSVAWVPLALLWFGISEKAVLFIVILEAFIPCALGVKTAVMNIPREIIRAAQTLGARNIDLYLRVIIPAIIPQTVSSLRLSWAFAWRALIAGELFTSGIGIGQNLELGRSLADMSQVIAMILIIAILGYFSDNVFFHNIEKQVKKVWGL